RWRIRHKLMLGLATAIAILAMLLAGTLNGLWSYYVTMKSIRSKLNELDRAEELKPAVTELAQLPESTSNPANEFRVLAERIPKARTTLDAFEDAFRTTLSRELTTDDGAHLSGLIASLRTQLDELGQSIPDHRLFEGMEIDGRDSDKYSEARGKILK